SSRTEVGFLANSAKELRIEPSSGYEHTLTVLRALAELKNGCGEHIDDFMQRQDFRSFTDIIFITHFLSEKTAQALCAAQAAGKCCTVYATNPDEIEQFEALRIPRRYYPPEGGDED
ncbi:MAG: hypothetical protein ACI4Q4_07670, partial [Oscillospiraceae bacterium]